MLELNGKRVSATELIAKFEKHPNGKGLTNIFERLKRNPVFLINSAVKRVLENGVEEYINPKRKTDSKGYDVQMRFTFWDDFTGDNEDPIRVEVRYYKTKTDRTSGNGITKVIYTPRAIDLAGAFHRVEKDDELAVFMLLAPSCGTSPLHDPETSSTYVYEDKVKKAEKSLKKYDLYTTIANILSSLDESDLPFISRGLGIQGVQDMSSVEIKSAVTAFAYENRESFVEKYNNSLVEFEGRILFGLESDLFDKKELGGVATFFWGKKGTQPGKLIFQAEYNSVNPNEEFMNYLKSNKETFVSIIMSGSKKILADEGLKEYIDIYKNPTTAVDHFKAKEDEPLYLSSVVDTNSAREFVMSKHPENRQGSPANMKKFLEAVQSGGLNDENVLQYLIDEVFPKESK